MWRTNSSNGSSDKKKGGSGDRDDPPTLLKGPSPTGVIETIDLTVDSDDPDEDLSDADQRERLGVVRKRLNKTNNQSRSRNSTGGGPKKTNNGGGDDDDDDDDILEIYESAGLWSCSACTYAKNWNRGSTRCEMCNTERPTTATATTTTTKADDSNSTGDGEEKKEEESESRLDMKPAAKKKDDKKRKSTKDDTTAAATGSVVVASPPSASSFSLPSKRAKVKKEGAPRSPSSATAGMDGVEIVAPQARPFVPAAAAAAPAGASKNNDDDDDDVVLEGVLNETRLPHMRPHCTTCKFDAERANYNNVLSRSVIDKNSEACDLCFCYVCDCPQAQCQRWKSTTSTGMSDNHCCANDKDYRWVRLRAGRKAQTGNSATDTTANERHSSDDENNQDGVPLPPPGYHFMAECINGGLYWGSFCHKCWCYVCNKAARYCEKERSHKDARHSVEKWRKKRELRMLPTFGKCGPWRPDDLQAVADSAKDKSLIQCRHCHWFLRLKKSHLRHCPTSDDWCPLCGLVATEKDLEKDQIGTKSVTRWSEESDEEENEDEDESEDKDKKVVSDSAEDVPTFLLGMKTIPFSIKAHDPRKIVPYKHSWAAHSRYGKWTYDGAARREEVFLHRLGKAPKLDNLMNVVPVVTDKKVVEEISSSTLAHKNDTDAVIIKDRRMINLLNMMNRLPDACAKAKLAASWDRTKQEGTIELEFYLHKRLFIGNGGPELIPSGKKILSCLLSLWFDDVRFNLSDLTGHSLKPERNPACLRSSDDNLPPPYCRVDLPIAPYTMSGSEKKKLYPKIAKSFKQLMNYASNHFKESRDELSLVGSESSRYQGGISPSPTDDQLSLKGSLSRFFGEHFHDLIDMPSESLLLSSCHGLNSIHKGSLSYSENNQILFALLGVEKAIAAKAMYHDDASKAQVLSRSTFSNAQSIVSTVKRLENLSHEEVLHHDIDGFVDGFELLPFQRQSLKWAVERELTPGGIQSYWWPELPASDGRRDPVWFCPILNMLKKEKPRVVRGGLICEEMGLGKTVISLGIILKNPAPVSPPSGSQISELNNSTSGNSAHPNSAAASAQSPTAAWDKDLYSQTSDENPKIGTILSRGTLVVCPVSLVGQWIEEAKSKLDDPGLVYPYHGQNRKRNAFVLAQNSIVVTTYNVLASDKYYHSSKGGKEYCSPLAQIRWWRIIFDEGHCLRDGATKNSKAAAELVSNHKWIVTGTPFSTSVLDLKNMLKVIGIEHVDRLFSAMVAGSSNRRGLFRSAFYDVNSIMYLLRPILLRHSQQMKYRNSDITLMQLPKKTERVLMVKLSPEEKRVYYKMEKTEQDWYLNYRSRHKHDMSKHYLTVSSRLTALRDACSGGKYSTGATVVPTDDHDTDDMDEKPRKKAETVLSAFSFTSKLKVLLEELERTKNVDPSSKSLVFSQYKTTLDWLKEELPKHGYQFRSLSGDMSMKARAKALHDFQNDPPTTIFLLSMRSGAVGINLTQANNVYILEPHMNPAVEAQAIGRVHRLGQKRPVQITRLIVEDSVETRILKFLSQKYGTSSTTAAESTTKKEDNGHDDPHDKNPKSDNAGIKAEGDTKKNKDKETVENTVIGSIRTEKAQANLEQFDLLFGVEEEVKKAEELERQQQQQVPMMPDANEDGGLKPDIVSSYGLV